MDMLTTPLHTSAGSVLLHDRYDEKAYKETASVYPDLGNTVSAHTAAFPSAESLVEDVFFSMYKAVPTFIREEEQTPAQQVTAHLLQEMMGTTEYTNVRNSTVGDNFTSAIATVAVGSSLLKGLDARTKKRLQDLSDLDQEADKLFNQAQALEEFSANAPEEQAEQMQQQAQGLAQQAETARQQAQKQAAALDADMEKLEDMVRRAGRAGLDQAEEQIEAAEHAVKAFAGGYSLEQGAPTQLTNIKEKLALAQQVMKSRKLQQIAELAGRMVRTALHKQKTKVKHPPDEVIGITIGDDLFRTLPSDLALLADPDLEDLFFARMLGERLMIYDMRGTEKQGKGPIVGVVDSSGSMDEVLGNGRTTKEVWAKACLLALLAIAKKQKRDFAVMHFSGPGQVKTYRFYKAEATPKQLLACCEFFYNGGTVYDKWMDEALQIIEESRFSKADVICISDGDVHIPQPLETMWNSRRKAKEMHCYSILLAVPRYSSYTHWLDNLTRVSDRVVPVADLEADAEALETMFTI